MGHRRALIVFLCALLSCGWAERPCRLQPGDDQPQGLFSQSILGMWRSFNTFLSSEEFKQLSSPFLKPVQRFQVPGTGGVPFMAPADERWAPEADVATSGLRVEQTRKTRDTTQFPRSSNTRMLPDDLRRSEVCSGMGVASNIALYDACSGGCKITKMMCNGHMVLEDQIEHYEGSLDVCFVTQMSCHNSTKSYYSFSHPCTILTMVRNNAEIPREQALASDQIGKLECSFLFNSDNVMSDQSVVLDFGDHADKKSCIASEVYCNGTLVNPLLEVGDFSGCELKEAPCDDIRCVGFKKTCDNTTGDGGGYCRFERDDCYNVCLESSVDLADVECLCPFDRSGARCEIAKPFSCAFTLLEPQRACVSGESLSGDAKCLQFSMKDTINFVYRIECRFENTTSASVPNGSRLGYHVLVQDDEGTVTFAVSRKRDASHLWNARLKIWNFNRLSDNSAVLYDAILPEHLANNMNLRFVLSMSNIKADKHIFGGRIYLEVGMDEEFDIISGLQDVGLDRQFIDPTDIDLSGSSSSFSNPSPLWHSVLAMVVLVGLTVGVVKVIYMVLEYRADRKRQHMRLGE